MALDLLLPGGIEPEEADFDGVRETSPSAGGRFAITGTAIAMLQAYRADS